eukprot:TRINITY_DN40715_c0_g1_i1.p1 TRINITY_DN40715_c0_g1~~TRINITY_DN40715_c0_g1_i1.p1  ORF type:complete len:614 (-),score=79.89 TRINITY_DN40715_c0_g1_i1:28-1809(-)
MARQLEMVHMPTLLGGTQRCQKLEGHELHERVDASRWCISRDDLDFFEKEVKRCVAESRIRDNPTVPNPYHEHPAIGPTIYQVTKHYIKPVTKAAGGMSWALMRNPRGLPCDVFATHGWKEGVFEFICKARRVWPIDARHMYICFLSNPQNGDISELLSGDLSNSPFARALRTARYMVVIPNHAQSIYKRLWCVYEAHLALERAAHEPTFEIVLPAAEKPCKVVLFLIPGVIIAFGGGLFCDFYLAPHIAGFLGPLMWLLMSFCTCEVIHNILHTAIEPACNELVFEIMAVSCCYLELFVTGTGAGLASYHLMRSRRAVEDHHQLQYFVFEHRSDIRYEEGEVLACTFLTGVVVLSCAHSIFLELIRQVIRTEGNQLSFESVERAECSVLADKQRISEAIEGVTELIDQRINALRVLGRYSHGLQKSLARGASLTRARDNTLLRCLLKCAAGCSAFCFWWVTDLTGSGHAQLAVILLAACTLATTSLAWRFRDESCFAVHSFYMLGLFFAVVSNNHHFFTRRAALTFSMTAATTVVQLLFFTCWLLALLHHYVLQTPKDNSTQRWGTDCVRYDSSDSEASERSILSEKLHRVA